MNRQKRLFGFLLCAAVLSSCDLFDENAVQEITGPTPTTARIKFHNFSPSSVGVNFFSSDVKMTAVSTTQCTPAPTSDSLRNLCESVGLESTTGVVYGTCTNAVCNGGLASAGLYVAITPGQHTLIAKMAAKDTIVSTVAQNIEDGKYYSFFMSGIYNTTAKTAEAFVVEDPIPDEIDFEVAHVRFVNAISNGTGDLNLFATQVVTPALPDVTIGGATAYKTAGGFTAVPAGTYNLRVAYTGAGTNLITRSAVSFEGGRVYTVTARGSTATAATLGLDNTQNQR